LVRCHTGDASWEGESTRAIGSQLPRRPGLQARPTVNPPSTRAVQINQNSIIVNSRAVRVGAPFRRLVLVTAALLATRPSPLPLSPRRRGERGRGKGGDTPTCFFREAADLV